MENPFETTDGRYVVLTNDEGQHSLWRDFLDVPAGWTVTYGPDSRAACVEYVNASWTDLRPNTVRS